MLNRVLEISQENRTLSLNRGFIVIKEKGIEIASIPLDDIAVLLLSAQSTCVTKHILNALAERGCITVFCGDNYIPVSILIPECQHYQFSRVLESQINASVPFKKRIWQQIIIRKIENQAKALQFCAKQTDAKLLFKIAQMVNSGDTQNREAYAAKTYFKALFGQSFIRDKNGEGINSLLNYGYAVMRAGMARAVCSSGLLPALGVHHKNYSNQFCLVDDLFEIYRPLVDCLVYQLYKQNKTELTPSVKQYLVKGLQIKLQTTEGSSPAVQSMLYYASSYVRALDEKQPVIDVPEWQVADDGITILE